MAIAGSPSGGNATSTLWYQGGERMTSSSQTDNLWTNALLSIDLTTGESESSASEGARFFNELARLTSNWLPTDWRTGTPAIKLVEADNGNYSFPPAVACERIRAERQRRSSQLTALSTYSGRSLGLGGRQHSLSVWRAI